MDRATQVLALDGGGFRGLSQAVVLAAMEERTGRKTADCFDVVAGTSTGGILALALGLRIPAQAVVDFYIKDGKSIFATTRTGRIIRWFRRWVFSKHSAESLKAALQRYLGEKQLGESSTRLVIPSFDLDLRKPYLFKTDHATCYESDWKHSMWEIAMATSAAPTYFPYYKSTWGKCYADGGLWANNPSLVGAVEAIKVMGRAADTVKILNLGNGCADFAFGRPSLAKQFGVAGWAMDIADLLMDASAISVAGTAKLLWGNRFLRIEPKLTNKLCPLDHYRPDELNSHAHEVVRQNAETLRPYFEHDAAPYLKMRRVPPTV